MANRETTKNKGTQIEPDMDQRSRVGLTAAVLSLASLTFAGGRDVAAGDPQGGRAAPVRQLTNEEEDLAKKVNAAIERSQKWFIATQSREGYWFKELNGRKFKVSYGEQALVLFALVKSGLTTKDDTIKNGLKALDTMLKETGAKSLGSFVKVYEASCLLLLYSSLYDQRKSTPGGPGVLEKRMRELAAFLQSSQLSGGWRYPGNKGSHDLQDLSNTQYALYGLHMAASCGIPVKSEVWKQALKYVLSLQKATGEEVDYYSENPTGAPGEGYDQWKKNRVQARGFEYLPGFGQSGSMATAGISSLTLIREHLDEAKILTEDDRKAVDAAVLGGLAWLSSNFAVDRNPPKDSKAWGYYYLYGLERTGSFMKSKFIGQSDWYREGAEYLVRQQQKDGSWSAGLSESDENPLVQSSFATLFLVKKSPQTSYRQPVLTESAKAAPAPDPRDAKPEDPENSK